MEELLFKEMSKEKIIAALEELKHLYFGKSPSKYFFALGHAIRAMNSTDDPQP